MFPPPLFFRGSFNYDTYKEQKKIKTDARVQLEDIYDNTETPTTDIEQSMLIYWYKKRLS